MGKVTFVVPYAPPETDPNTKLKTAFWEKLGHLINQTPTKKGLFGLIGANVRTGTRMGRGNVDDKVLGAYGRDELHDKGERLLTCASDSKLARTRTSFLAHGREKDRIHLTASAAKIIKAYRLHFNQSGRAPTPRV